MDSPLHNTIKTQRITLLHPYLRHRSNHINSNLYHYGGNNPVKYVDPDGRETEDTAEGKIIHSLISLKYAEEHKNEKVYTNKTMSTIMYKLDLIDKGLGKSDLGVRPDIWNVSTNEMYEIKPVTQSVDIASKQLQGYIELAKKYGLPEVKAGEPTSPGTSGHFVLKELKLSVRYWCPVSGVILYSKNQISQPQTSFSSESNLFSTLILGIMCIGLMKLSGIPIIP